MDKYGIEHWITTDQYGNEVECFANKFAEVHTKRPICVCGEPMVETRELEWDCPKCGHTSKRKMFPEVSIRMIT